MSDADIATVHELLDAAAVADGRYPLSDHLAIDLADGGGSGFTGIVMHGSGNGPLTAYGQVSRANDAYAVELVVHPQLRAELATIGDELLAAATDAVADGGGGDLSWWVFEPTEDHHRLATSAGLAVGRRLHQMRRGLPTGLDVTIETRAFVPGVDDTEWLAVNNRAFAGHGEQGGWTADTLRTRLAEPWFDPEGFRVHEREGRMAGFCWTKVHPPTAPADGAEGEIYVIAVDPDFHGLGLGTQLTLAGLEHLSDRGISAALLYVDADNAAAGAVYRKLGFEVAATNVAFVMTVEGASR
ncbi:MAG: mycothiol synthase [Ilumatobacter sp.]|nr:mycothiol synthase [Ilumatobacter sp.]